MAPERNAPRVTELDHTHVEEVVDILCESFHDYPVMRFVLGSPKDYDLQLNVLIHLFVMSRVFRDEVILGIGEPGALQGAALVSYPDGRRAPLVLDRLRESVWVELGSDARERYESFGVACAQFSVDAPQLHLNMIGVRRRAQGSGLGSGLIDYVHQMSLDDPASTGVSLSTENAENVPLYEHLGYGVIGHAVVSPQLQTWALFRRDRDVEER